MIDKLEFLLAIAHEKHFGRAAEACGVTQPTLSAGIKQLEETLGVMLVRRGSRFLGFTAEGERVLEWAKRIIADARAMRQDVESLKRGLSGHLRIGVIPTALPVVAALTAPFQARHPHVRYTVLARNSDEILELVSNLNVDAGLTYIDNEPLGNVAKIPLYRERYRLVTQAGNPLAGRAFLTWDEAAATPLCLLTGDMQNRRIIERNLQKAGAQASIMLESSSMIVLYSHVRCGLWSAILPEKLLQIFGTTLDLITIPIVSENEDHIVGLVTGPREPLTPLVSALMQEAKRVAAILDP